MWSKHQWLFGLTSSDELARRKALARFRKLSEDLLAANAARNDVYWRAGREWSPTHAVLSRAMDSAREEFSSVYSKTIYSPLSSFISVRRVPQAAPKPVDERFAVLFLEWEQAFPEEWDREARGWGSRWGWKESLLKVIGRHGIGASHRSAVERLALTAISRPYRAKDWLYARVARQLDNPAFRASLHSTANLSDDDVKLKAAFVTSRLTQAELSVNRRSYDNWRLDRAATLDITDTNSTPQQ